MTFKFAVLGDSIAQGFQNGAVGPESPIWSFPAIIAKSLDLAVGVGAGHDFRVPKIPGDGLPLDIYELLRRVAERTGDDINVLEWPARVIPEIAEYFDELETFYEEGAGSKPLDFTGVYHNLAAHGLSAFDSGNVTAKHCDEIIAEQEGWFRDDPFGTPSGAKFRAAKMIIDPAGTRPAASQLDNLDYLVNGNPALGLQPEGVDALIVWLGANDCLGTVVELEVRDMADDPAPDLTVRGRSKYNLTSATVFGDDYEKLAKRIDKIFGERKIQVFVGTVPDVTIPPIAKGLGDVKNDVYPHYVRFFVDGEKHTEPPLFHKSLSGDEVRVVQERVAQFNRHIKAIVKARPNWHLVDTAKVLAELAVRRQGLQHEEPLRRYYHAKNRADHPLLVETLIEKRGLCRAPHKPRFCMSVSNRGVRTAWDPTDAP